jgi:C4-dicarboxylate-specific signal transduction histidine kinase
MTSVPSHLQESLCSFVAEDVVSSLRHSVVNDLTALAALCYRLKIEHVFDMSDEHGARAAQDLLDKIQAYVKMASRRLEVTFVPTPAPAHGPVDVVAVLSDVLARMPPPAGVEVDGPTPGVLSLRMDRAELELALACLLSSAYEALAGRREGRIKLSCAPGPDNGVRVDLEHDGAMAERTPAARVLEPFAAAAPGKVGLGLNIARRVAVRWGGSVELAASPSRGIVTTMSLPEPSQPTSY